MGILAASLALVACSGDAFQDTSIDASPDTTSAGSDAAVTDTATPDTATPDTATADTGTTDTGTADTGTSGDADAAETTADGSADATDGALVCPDYSGGYTFMGSIPAACPTGTGDNVYDTVVTVDTTTCTAGFLTADAASNRLRIVANVSIGATGNFGPTSVSLNGVSTTCTGTYFPSGPQRIVFDCGDCDFTLQRGE